ncbi:MAG: L,D-transpeptidase family protein [Blautia sp.]
MKEEIRRKDREKSHTSRVKRAEEEKRRKLAKRIAAQQQKVQNADVGEEITSAMEKIILDTIGEEVHLSEKKTGKREEKKEPEKSAEKAEEVKKPENPEEEAKEAKEPEKAEGKAEEAKEPEKAEEKAEEAKEPEKAEEKAEEAKEPEKPEEKAEEAKEPEKAEEKAEEAKEPEKPEEKAEKITESVKPEETGTYTEQKESEKLIEIQNIPATGKKVDKKKVYSGIVGAAVLLLLGVYGAGTYYYKDRLFKGTSVNHVVCSNQTAESAENLIRQKVEDYTLEVKFRNDQVREIKGKDISYKYIDSGFAKKVIDEQNPFLWIKGYFVNTEYETGHNVEFDEDALKAQLYALDCMQVQNMEAPADAQIAFQDNQFVIQEEVQGTTVKGEVLFEAVEEAVNKGEKSVSAEDAGAYAAPSVLKDNETLIHQKEVWNSCATVTVTYTFGDKQEILDGLTVKDWMTYDESGNYVENKDALMANINSYVAELANTYNTVGRNRTITRTATGEPVTISGGSYGFRINQQKEAEQLYEDIMNHAVTTREPIYTSTAVSYGENDIGNTYVEVDLSYQHLWFYKAGALIMDTDFVSGTYYASDRRTPSGAYALMYKQKDQVLRGTRQPDGTYEYESPVKYWMPFNGGIGFHDASWRGSFGGSIYLYSGSHGCVNLPTSAAATLYENIEAGCPVLCFY